LIATEFVPWLPALLWSPLYVAVMVGVAAAVSVYVTWHCPEEIVQGFEVNEPVAELVLKLTVPVGLSPPVSVAVHVVCCPTTNDGHDAVVVGVA